MRVFICLLMIVSLLPLAASADYFSGNDIVDLFDNKYPESNALMRGYFAGVQDAHNGTHFCVPPEVTLDQASAIIIRYIRDNPDLRYKVGKNLVIEALSNVHPCDAAPKAS